MRKSILGLSAVLFATVATPAFAQDEPTPAVTITANAAVVTDYRFRGVSQTDKRFALQGGITASHASGFYVSVWGSSIDDYVAVGSDQELDLIGGYTKTIGAATFDVGVLYYYYPGSNGANTDFVEPYASIKGTFGPATAKLTANYAPKTKALTIGNGKEDNLYIAGDLSATVPNTPFGVSAHLGHDIGPSYLVPTVTKKTYTDWNIGATYTWNHLTFGVSYVDTNRDAFIGTRNITKAGVVGSITAAF